MDWVTRTLRKGALFLSFAALWALIAEFGPWPGFLFPGPVAVADSLVRLALDGRLFSAIAISVRRLAEGYSASIALGVPLGIAMARLSVPRIIFKPVVNGLQALPSICWLPLALLWFGLSEATILFVVIMGSVLAIAIAAEDGVNSIQPQLLQVAGTLGIRGLRFWGGVLLPAALPGIVTGLKLGWSFAWRALLAAELLFVSGGLGQLLTAGRELLDVAQVMGVMIAIIFIGYAMDRLLFRVIELRVRQRWGLVAAT